MVGFMDIGTNSVRLLLARILPNHSYSVLSQQKEVVRLGKGEFPHSHLRQDAMNRAVLVCARFAEMARSFGAAEVVAVATSASREASNQEEFIERLRREAGLDVRVISGKEEARLIYLGVSSGMHLGKRRALFVDIGGGSTELIVGNSRHYEYLDTLKLGAIRLTSLFPGSPTGKVGRSRYKEIVKYISNAAVQAVSHVRGYKVELAVGSSGTIMNLAEIATRRFEGRSLERDDVMTHEQLKEVLAHLCSLTLEQRRKVAGINPERADIIIAGGAIIDTLMDELGLGRIQISDRGLRDGMLVNYLKLIETGWGIGRMSPRERSVLLLGRACHFDEGHAHNVASLAGQLFDTAREQGFHAMGDWERELLHYASLLHDVGVFLSFVNHQDHTYYLIRNSDLLGFDQTEIAIIAAVARFHRKGVPTAKQPEMADIGRGLGKTVLAMSSLLRLAEVLDRSHAGVVTEAAIVKGPGADASLEVSCRGDCQLEMWGVQGHLKYFQKAFGCALHVRPARRVRRGRAKGRD